MNSYPKFANFGEYIFYAYANVQMLFLAEVRYSKI